MKTQKEDKTIITIGQNTAEIQQKLKINATLAQNRKMMQEKREERKKEEKKTKDQLFVINEAKIKMGAHIGTFKVLSDTPTIQGKTVGTKIEKSPVNFSFLDGFQVLSVVGDWQDVGSAKYQDNEALIKKSTLTVTGKMPPPNAPIEQGKIEFIDSGQINVVDNLATQGMPVPNFENKTSSTPSQNDTFVVHFRPHDNYNGEFGFDWIRTGDTDKKGDTPFNESVGYYYEDKYHTQKYIGETWSNFFKIDTKKLEELTKLFTKNEAIEPEYFLPKMTLLKDKEAVLKLIAKNIEKNTEKSITFDFENLDALNHFEIKTNITKISDLYNETEIKITCKNEFKTLQTLQIKVGNKICGALEILPNAQEFQKTLEVVFVYVNNFKPEAKISKDKEMFIKNILNQAFINPKFTPDFFKFDLTHHLNKGKIKNIKYLLSLLEDDYKKNRKKEMYKDKKVIFIINAKADNVLGLAPYYYNFAICINQSPNNETMVHELLHLLGLSHTFTSEPEKGKNGKMTNPEFTYKAKSTNNIMDYSHQNNIQRVSLFYWQWKQINNKIK